MYLLPLPPVQTTKFSASKVVENELTVTLSQQGYRVHDENCCTTKGEVKVKVTGSNLNGM
jgi:hypothetical protein